MSKAPAFQFYPSDWQRDMDDYPLEIEGAWIRICCRLYWSGGSATKSEREWARILRADLRQTRRIFAFFLSHNICDLDNQNGTITITSRRIVRDEKIREIRKESGSKGGNPALKKHENLDKQSEEQKPTPSSSASSSKPKTKDAPSPDVKTAIDHFYNETLRLKGFKPEITAKDAALVKKDLKHGIDHVKGQIDFFLRNGKSKEHITLAAAMSADTHNSYMAEISKPRMRFDNLP